MALIVGAGGTFGTGGISLPQGGLEPGGGPLMEREPAAAASFLAARSHLDLLHLAQTEAAHLHEASSGREGCV